MSAIKQPSYSGPPKVGARPRLAAATSLALLNDNAPLSELVNRDDVFLATMLVFPSLLVFALMTFAGSVSPVAPGSEALLKWGANYGPVTLNLQYLRWLTAIMLPVGFLHLAVNTLAMYRIVPLMSAALGARRTTVLYVCSGIAASLCTTAFAPSTISAGSSGAVMGLYGVFFPVVLLRPSYRKMGFFTFGSVALSVGLVIAFGHTHANVGHMNLLGGFLFGLITGCMVAAQDGNVPEKFVVVVTVALCALTANSTKRDVNPYQLATDFEAQFRPGQSAITRISGELRSGHPPTKSMLNDLENAAQLLKGIPDKAQSLYEQARAAETRAAVAKIMMRILANRVYLNGMIAQTRYALELSPADLKALTGEPGGYGAVYGRIAGNLTQVKQADVMIHVDLDAIRKLADDNKLDAQTALAASGGDGFLKKTESLRADLRKLSRQLLQDVDTNTRRHYDEFSARAQQAASLPPEQLGALAKSAGQDAFQLVALFQQVDHDEQLKYDLAAEPAAVETMKRLHIFHRGLSYYQPYFTMYGFWKEHSGLAVKPEDNLYFRDNVMDRYVAVRGLFADDAQDPVSQAVLAAVQSASATGSCVQTVMARGTIPVWDRAHPGHCVLSGAGGP